MLKNRVFIPLILLAAVMAGLLIPAESPGWVIDPAKCISCGRCAESCVRPESAVKAVINYSQIGNVEYSPAMFRKTSPGSSTALDNRVCPTDAITREVVDDSTWQYSISEADCIGCGACAIRSKKKGSGAFSLLITDKCLSCNECAIAIECPVGAISRAGEKRDN